MAEGKFIPAVLRVSVGFCVLSGVLWGQAQQTPPPASPQAPEAPQTRIQVQVNEVIVPVTVTDDRGRYVEDLDVNDFRILDEGQEQKIRFFTRERGQPVVVGFILDMSNTTRLHWKTYQEAAIEMVAHLVPGDKKFSGYLISAGNTADLLVNTTHDPEPILERIRKMKPGGGAALFDAIWKACTTRQLIQGEPYEPRRILIIIGDGHDTASNKTLDQVVEVAQRNLVTIYGLSTQAYGFVSDGNANLVRLCEETGGRITYPLEKLYSNVSGYLSTPSDEGNYAYKVGTGGYASEVAQGIFRSIATIAGEVTTQYILRYVPDGPANGAEKQFRNIRVEVPALPNIKIRARKGYYPFSP
jgi:Ca-activated chloride channel homolog